MEKRSDLLGDERRYEGQSAGFLLVHTPEAAWSRFVRRLELRDTRREQWEYLEFLHARLAITSPEAYAGVDREPVQRGSAGLSAVNPFPSASEMLLARYGVDPNVICSGLSFDADLMSDLPFALEVLRVASESGQLELVRVDREDRNYTLRTIGWDVGVWGFGHYSAARDCFVTGEFHPAPSARVRQLREHARKLNGKLLFESEGAATLFLDWYRSQDWSEVEDENLKLEVIRVDTV